MPLFFFTIVRFGLGPGALPLWLPVTGQVLRGSLDLLDSGVMVFQIPGAESLLAVGMTNENTMILF